MNKNNIACPNCGTEISIDQVLTQQIESQLKKSYELKQQESQKMLLQKQEELLLKEQQVDQIVAQKLSSEKTFLLDKVREDVQKEKIQEISFLEKQLQEKNDKLTEARNAELEIRKEKMQLEEDKRSFEIKMQQQLDAERVKIVEDVKRQATEEQQYKVAELNKQLSDAMKVNDEMRRKLEQGSQQTQGEVLELEIEELLRREFPLDEIAPVGKGVNGADIIQRVHDRSGRQSGQIIWELKRTKTWSEGWIQKLKDDQRIAKADIAVLISISMPDGVKSFQQRNGVWVTNLNSFLGLASALRMSLLQVASIKSASVGKNEKMEVLYDYLSGIEFKQKIEGIVEAFVGMKEELEKEKRAYQKIWAHREKQIQRVVDNTVGMYGDLGGLMGKALPQIKLLEITDGDALEISAGSEIEEDRTARLL